jgi:glycosyltransferase involved in cell wall biosynthesis
LKIALVVPGGVDRSGEYRVIPALLALVRRLAARHELHVFALRQEPRQAEWTLLGARVHNIGQGWTRVRAVRAIRAEHRCARFQLVQSVWSAACGLVAVTAASSLGIPSLVHVAGGEPARLPEIRFGGRLTWRGRLQELLVLRGADLVTAASTPLVRALAGLGCRAERLPLGVDLEEWPPCAPAVHSPAVDGAPARLVHVASLNRVKDQPTLLRALALLAGRGIEFELDVAGEDTLGGEVQRLTRTLGLESRVRFHGFLPQRRLAPLVRSARVLVVSSRHEAGPLAVLEAAVAGVPTVGTAVGHIAEWSPVAALATPIGDPSALAAALLRIITDEELRLRIAREAARRALLEDADYTARRFEALYSRLSS